MTTQTIPWEMEKPLDYEAGPLVWVDCEMTGLDLQADKLLEIAVRGSSRFYPDSVSTYGLTLIGQYRC